MLIKHNGKTIADADAKTIKMVFQNLNGKNFANKDNPKQEHADYLERMKITASVNEWTGKIEMVDNGVIIDTHHF
ncbi:hypothetical protein F7U66_01310 [Vibrio parahaemolyticus]|nr:hypothetical protein [Vibrio parahaemolyticus]